MPRDLYCLNCGVHFVCHMKGQERFYEAWVPIRRVQEDTGLQHIREILGLNQASVCAIKKNKNFGLCKDCFKYLQTIKRCENEINEAKDDFIKQNKEGSFLYKRRNLNGPPQQDMTTEESQIPKVIFLTPKNLKNRAEEHEQDGFVRKKCLCRDLGLKTQRGDSFKKAIASMAHSGYSTGFKLLVNGSECARKEFHTFAQSLIRTEIRLYLRSSKYYNTSLTLELLKNFSWNDLYDEIREKLPFTYLVLEAILVPINHKPKLKIDENGKMGELVPVLGMLISSMLKQRKKRGVTLIQSIISVQLFKDRSFNKAFTVLKDLGATITPCGAEVIIKRLMSGADPNLSIEAIRKRVPESKIFPLSKLYSQTEETGNHSEMENESEEESGDDSENVVESESDEEADNRSEEEAVSGSEEEVVNGRKEEDESGSETESANEDDEADTVSEEEAENGNKSDTVCDKEAEERSLEKTVSNSSTQPFSRTSENSTASISGRLETESPVTAGSHVTAAWTESVLLDVDKDISVSDMSSAFMSLDDFSDTTCTESPVVGGSLELSENEVLPVISVIDHEYAMLQKEKETGDCRVQNSHQGQPTDSAEDNIHVEEIGDRPGRSESGQSSVKSGMKKKNKRKCHGMTDLQVEAKKQKVVHSGESGATGVELGERNNRVAQNKANIKDKHSKTRLLEAAERPLALRNESEATEEAISEDADCTKDDSASLLTGDVNTDEHSENSMPGIRKGVRKWQPNVRGKEIDDFSSRVTVIKSGMKKLTGQVDADRPVETGVSENTHHGDKAVNCLTKSKTPNLSSTLYQDEEYKVQKNFEYLKSHGFQITKSRMKSVVCKVVRASGKIAKYRNFDLDNGPSVEWFRVFLMRKKIPGMSFSTLAKYFHLKATTEQKVKAYFVLLNSMIKDLGLEDKPKQIYNCGEFSLGDIAKVKLTGDSEDSSLDSSVGGQSSVQLAVSAAGRVMFPFFVVQNATTRSNLSETSEDTIVQGCLLGSSDTGCMNEDLFCKWFHKVFLISRTHSKVPTILLMNNSSSFLCPEVIQSAIPRLVHIIYTPPEVSHNLLPLDHSIFGLLKHHMKKNVLAEIIDSKELVESVKHALSQLLFSDISQAFRNTCIYSYEAEEPDADILSSKPALMTMMTPRRHVKKHSKKFSAPTCLSTTLVPAGQSVMATNTVSQNAFPSAVSQSQLQNNPAGTVSQNVVPSAVSPLQLQKNPVGTVSQNVVPNVVGQSQLRKNPVGTLSQYVVRSAASQSQQQRNPVGTVSHNVAPNVVGQSQLRKNPVGTLSQYVVRSAASQPQQQKNPFGTVSQNVVPNVVGQSQLQKNPVGTLSQYVVRSAASHPQQQKNPVGTLSQYVVRSAASQPQQQKNPFGTVSQNVVPNVVGQSQLQKNPVGTLSQYVVRSAASQPQQQKNPFGTVSQNVVPNVVGQSQQQKNPVGQVLHNVGHKNTVALGQTQQNNSESPPLAQLLQKPGITAVPHVIPKNCTNDGRFVILQSNLENNQNSKQNIKKPNDSGFVEVKVWNSTGYTHLLLPKVGTKIKGQPDRSELLSSEINNSSNVVSVKEEPPAQGSSVEEQEASPVALYMNKANKQ